MFFFFYYDCVCSFRLFLVSYLMQLQFIKFGVSVAPRYVPSPSSPMPVTTRSQSKRPQNDNRVHSFTSTSGSHLSLTTSSKISTCNFTTASSVPVLPCICFYKDLYLHCKVPCCTLYLPCICFYQDLYLHCTVSCCTLYLTYITCICFQSESVFTLNCPLLYAVHSPAVHCTVPCCTLYLLCICF